LFQKISFKQNICRVHMRGVHIQEVREIFDEHLVELRSCTGVAALPLHLLIYIHRALGTVAITPQQIPPQFTHTTLYTHSPHAHALTRTRTRTLTRTLHKMSTRTPRTHCRSAVGTVAITPRYLFGRKIVTMPLNSTSK